MRNGLRFLAGALAALSIAGVAQAQSFPSKSISFVVPFAAGGPADLVAREVARLMGDEIGKPVIVENQPGGSGVVALNTMGRATADGYTLLFAASGTVVIHPLLTGKFESVTKQLMPVSLVSTSPHVLVVTSKIGVKSVQGLIDYAKANPGKLNFGSAGTGGAAHLGMEMFKSQAKIDAVHIPYKGTSQVIADLASGEVQALFSSMPSLKPLIDRGAVVAIGMSGPSAGAEKMGIPEISKAGLAEFGYTTWYGLFAPTGTPQETVEKLNAVLKKVLASPALAEKLSPQGLDVRYSTPVGLGELVQSEGAAWSKIIKDANISIK
ncbi:Bug family tripartite tricarboxylate transporter substrate binding protein [Zwartia vadi]|uniref:Bug family tripartite tricarboxylate transporter substrate binding protein n=1 Tax=Zwartia vadi TaxID=3058168 RepID=UPI0025B35B2C|nr:tripartite tricarboxylate transporter substrate binding protein [Zwartia vadi]MDN3987618.1 tripartite tricarboxylate transporter substrate binding protein [Zwartia vadi]